MKMFTENQLKKMEEVTFQAGVEHAVRMLCEKQQIIFETGKGYGACMKRPIDLGKADEVEAMVFELLHGRAPIEGELGEMGEPEG